MKELSEQAKLFLTENLKRLPDAKNGKPIFMKIST